ncbi:MAG: SusC/RagA family TonB-linked outer membrane protein [Bacteroidales bacterium]|nr:SusC/RagA family TonB-linked outer membrane protein [Bacteroidales bacterium]
MLFLSSFAYAQTRILTGVVIDEDKVPLTGAGIIQTGTKNGAVADKDGCFSMNIPAGKKVSITFSYIGMETKVVIVDPKENNIEVVLKSDMELDAAIINAGYGVIQNKENLTGSAFEVRSEDLRLKPSARIDDLLVGQVPGLNVIEDDSTGSPKIKIRIRGDGSLSASCEPLWVIDGVPVYTGNRTNTVTGTSYTVSPLSYMNPDDIESMTVLKDASTTALYGADGANGVILVTTKQASEGRTSYNISVKYGVTGIARETTRKFVTTEQWWDLAKLGWANSGRPMDAFPYRDNEHNSYSTTSTDWFKEYFGIGQNTEINFSASTGTKKLDNFFSLGVYFATTPVKGVKQQRYSLRDRVTLKFTHWAKAEFNISATYNHDDLFSVSNSYLEVIPIFSPYNADGSLRLYNYYSTSDTEYKEQTRKFVYNKIPEREYNDNYQNNIGVNADATVTFTPVKGLNLVSQTGFSTINIYEATYSSSKTLSGMSESGLNGYSRRSGVFSTVFSQILRANYNRTFFNRLSLSAMAGVEWTDKNHYNLNATGNGFVNDHIKEIAYADSSTPKGSSNYDRTKSLSYMAHASLTFDKKYTLAGSWRRQGNSAFSEFSRWSNFWSVSGSYSLHREKFFKVPWMHQLSFKASFGNNGNSRIDTSSSYGSYSISSGSYYGGHAGASQSSPANPGLSWETTWITNVGINLGFINRINIAFEYYHRRTENVLYSGRVSSVITDASVMRNVGEITNNGIEFTLDADIIKRPNFNWDLSINGARNRNMITKLYKDTYTGFFDSIWVEGASKDAWWLVRWAGVDPVTGAPMWYDYNGDLTYTFNYSDRVLLPQYTKQPELAGGFTNAFKIYDFDLRIMMDYSFGGWDYTLNFQDDGQNIIDENATVEELVYWKKPGDVCENPKFVYDHGTMSYYNSTRCLVSATYIQLRSVSLGYNLPSKVTKVLRMRSANISLIGDNLYLWTPGQRANKNSYTTMKYNMGMRRGGSIKLAVTF